MKEDETGNRYPSIDFEKCIACGLCKKICPAMQPPERHESKEAYAVWHTDEKRRQEGASGGAISAFYDYADQNEYVSAGVAFDDHWNLNFQLSNEASADRFKNSKYVASNLLTVLEEIKHLISDNRKVCFVGLPCQVAAVRKYIGKECDNLMTVDLICHGVCSNQYLKQHIQSIEQKNQKKAHKLFFRNPKFDTEQFHFTLEDDQTIFYDEKVNSLDVYQIGYHKAFTYRENCYNCQYTNTNRVSDLTVGDYWGLGKTIPFEGSKHHVSLVLVNTEKGKVFLEQVAKEGFITKVNRPVEESKKTQSQLNHPSIKTSVHHKFIKEYTKHQDFERAAQRAMKLELLAHKYHLQKYLAIIRRIEKKIRA